ncbi:MAG: ABC transporter substrate-binding protein [Halioglobus sp.]|jgi:phospholipid transport system substrate-binding protein|uniref:MlaC/ttg2D family ABC transporter substrate-binding protein n=1 Tax=Halioglobus sp. Uisw_031 TaxID=3230977 RepID=UPI003590F856
MSFRGNTVGAIALLLGWLASSQVLSQDQVAYDLVQDTTVRVMEVVVAADDYVDSDPERYYGQIQDLLDPLIDFRGFARSVMGPYASSERYRSLDEAGRKQLAAELDRFTAVMRASLVRTYSKGLLAFGGSRIELVLPETEDNGDADSSRLSVRQLIYADKPQPYVVMYQMGRNKSGDWKLRNVIIESVNLGAIYKDQFLASAREQAGNIDAVIDSWTTVVVDVES